MKTKNVKWVYEKYDDEGDMWYRIHTISSSGKSIMGSWSFMLFLKKNKENTAIVKKIVDLINQLKN